MPQGLGSKHSAARYLRKQRGETLAVVAARIGVSESTLSRFEMGAQHLRMPALEALAAHYGCSVGALLERARAPEGPDSPLQSLQEPAPGYEERPVADPAALRELRGLGREIWRGEDPDEYVRQLREGWG